MARGSITKVTGKRDTSYKVRFDAPSQSPESRAQRSKSFRTRKEAEAYLTQVRHAILDGSYSVGQEVITVDELCQRFIDGQEPNVRPSTQIARVGIVRTHILPRWADLPADRVNESMVQRMVDDLSRTKAPQTVHNVFHLLSRIYTYAVRLRLLSHNPCLSVVMPKLRSQRRDNVWHQREVNVFLNRVRDDRLFPLYRLILMTGLRRCEALALKWNAIDFTNRRLLVQANIVRRRDGGWQWVDYTKTPGSTRAIALDAETMVGLAAMKKDADERNRFAGVASEGTFLFESENGHFLEPKYCGERFGEIVRALRDDDGKPLPIVTLHGLRHTHASLLAEAGVDLRTIMERLGHTTPGMTLGRYMHGSIESDRKAADALASLLGHPPLLSPSVEPEEDVLVGVVRGGS